MVESPENSSTRAAIITVLRETVAAYPGANSDEALPPPVRFDGIILRIAEPIMEIQSKVGVDANAALKIETLDALWLGEAEMCTREGQNWSIRVRLRHVLRDFETLARLAERFGAAVPTGIPVRV